MRNVHWNRRTIVYVVEGETEKRLIEALKTDLRIIYPGKIRIFNVTQERIKEGLFMSCGQRVSFALVFDTDRVGVMRLKDNLEIMRKLSNCQEVICIPQVKNLEEELEYACNLRDVRILTKSQSITDFKRDFLRLKDIGRVLSANNFNIAQMWSHDAVGEYAEIKNESYKIKKC